MPRSRRDKASKRNYEKNPFQRLNKWMKRRKSPSDVYSDLVEGYLDLYEESVQASESPLQSVGRVLSTEEEKIVEGFEDLGATLDGDKE
ncbi:MAG: hypothetical protein V5A72_02930 [Candidatus Nanohaloarchaea archaeon]